MSMKPFRWPIKSRVKLWPLWVSWPRSSPGGNTEHEERKWGGTWMTITSSPLPLITGQRPWMGWEHNLMLCAYVSALRVGSASLVSALSHVSPHCHICSSWKNLNTAVFNTSRRCKFRSPLTLHVTHESLPSSFTPSSDRSVQTDLINAAAWSNNRIAQ